MSEILHSEEAIFLRRSIKAGGFKVRGVKREGEPVKTYTRYIVIKGGARKSPTDRLELQKWDGG